jgi:hypothetical protein
MPIYMCMMISETILSDDVFIIPGGPHSLFNTFINLFQAVLSIRSQTLARFGTHAYIVNESRFLKSNDLVDNYSRYLC